MPEARTLLRAVARLLGGPVLARVRGTSMMPRIRDGQLVVVDRAAPVLSGPNRGDLVVLRRPGADGEMDVKRIVGLPGERVSIGGGGVGIDGAALDEPYLAGRPGTLGMQEAVWELRTGEAFVMGDNRPRSTDSRDYGPIALARIEGLARPLWSPWGGDG